MKKLCFAFVFLSSTTSLAQVPQSLSDCSGIKNDKKRLECYDKLSAATSAQTKFHEAASPTNALKPDQKSATEDAIRAIRKMASATEVGISLREYGSRVIDMAAATDDALLNIPDSQLKSKILDAKKAYVDARQLWTAMFNTKYVSSFLAAYGSKLAEYGIDPASLRPADPFAKTLDMNKTAVLSPVWMQARKHLEEADELLKAGRLNP